jgi:hypothetical protein
LFGQCRTKRKFAILRAQNQIDFAETQTGAPRSTRLKEATETVKGLLWGANDNYWYMAMGLQAHISHLQGDTEGAMKTLGDIRAAAQALEVEMETSEVPKSEFPRAAIRYVEGRIQFDLAKKKQAEGATADARRLAGQAAGLLRRDYDWKANAVALERPMAGAARRPLW